MGGGIVSTFQVRKLSHREVKGNKCILLKWAISGVLGLAPEPVNPDLQWLDWAGGGALQG